MTEATPGIISGLEPSLSGRFQLLSLWTKFYRVTIQIKPLRQTYHQALFVFQYFTK